MPLWYVRLKYQNSDKRSTHCSRKIVYTCSYFFLWIFILIFRELSCITCSSKINKRLKELETRTAKLALLLFKIMNYGILILFSFLFEKLISCFLRPRFCSNFQSFCIFFQHFAVIANMIKRVSFFQFLRPYVSRQRPRKLKI